MKPKPAYEGRSSESARQFHEVLEAARQRAQQEAKKREPEEIVEEDKRFLRALGIVAED